MRGDLVTVAVQGDFGKPRPALVIQADLFSEHGSVTILPVTSNLIEAPLFRIAARPTEQNGLRQPSQIMVDKVLSVRRDKLGPSFGRIEAEVMLEVERCLAVFVGIAR